MVIWAIRNADTGIKKTKIIVNFRNGADAAARVVGGAFLVNGNRRAQSFNRIDVWLLKSAQKLTGIARKRFDVAALAFIENRVESQGAFPGSRQTRENRQRPLRNLNVNIFQVILPGPFH